MNTFPFPTSLSLPLSVWDFWIYFCWNFLPHKIAWRQKRVYDLMHINVNWLNHIGNFACIVSLFKFYCLYHFDHFEKFPNQFASISIVSGAVFISYSYSAVAFCFLLFDFVRFCCNKKRTVSFPFFYLLFVIIVRNRKLCRPFRYISMVNEISNGILSEKW